MSTATPATILRRAADHIERVGWIQGQMFPTDPEVVDIPVAELPCCGLGAVAVVSGKYTVALSQPDTRPAEERIEGADRYDQGQMLLESYVKRHDLNLVGFARYNDSTRRTKEEVVATMRAAADEAEAKS